MIRFESPLAFLALLLIPLVMWLGRRRGRRAALRFSSIRAALQSGQSWRQAFIWIPGAVRVLVLILVVVALARPQRGTVQVRDFSKGVAIAMVMDRSSSMRQELSFRGSLRSRLEVVKTVFAEFVNGNDRDLQGRPNDLIGMVAFARYADTVCPLTLGHGALSHFLDTVQIVRRRSEDGTAIGDAVALAAARLKTAEQTLAQQAGDQDEAYQIKSKVIVLLTDGENNCGDRTPLQAAELARKWGIRIYTIAVTGSESGGAIRTPLGAFKLPFAGGGFDTTTLQRMARMTDGAFFKAEDGKALERICSEIDALERTEIESVRHVDYRELFPMFVGAALILLVAEVVMRSTLFRRIP